MKQEKISASSHTSIPERDNVEYARSNSTSLLNRPMNQPTSLLSLSRNSFSTDDVNVQLASSSQNGMKKERQFHSDQAKNMASRRRDSQKVVTFYRYGNSSRPEVRIVINSKIHSIHSLMKELKTALNLHPNEQRIFKEDRTSVEQIEDFEDGGSYFFSNNGADHTTSHAIYLQQDIGNSNRPNMNSRESRSNKKVIKVITNENSTDVWNLWVEEHKLISFSQVLHDLNQIIQPEMGRVAFLCTSKGRRVRGLAEFLHSTDTFVAIVNSIGMEQPDRNNITSANREIVKQAEQKPSKYDVIKGQDSKLDKKLIIVQGNKHVFYPTSNKYSSISQKYQPNKLPEQKLQLDWIYGYNGEQSRGNVYIIKSEELIYYAASVVVIYDIYRNKQRYYTEHTMKITCMALHPNNWYVATGQAAPDNSNIGVLDHIRIWNADYLNTLAVLSLEEQTLSVICLTFSLEDNGWKLASVDSDGNNYRLLVWDWNKRKIIAESQSYEEKECCVKFHPFSNKTLMSVGNGHVFFWTWRGNILEKYKGHFFGCELPDVVSCLVFLSNGDAVTGDSNGNLHFWSEGSRRTKQVLKVAKKGGVQSLFVLSHDMLISYSIDNNLLSLWETRDEPREPTINIEISGDHGDVTSIAVSPDHHYNSVGNIEIFLGTNRNRILRGTFRTQFSPIVKGHVKETTALASNPHENHIATAGLDDYVIYRSADDHSIIWEQNMGVSPTALAFYPDGDILAIGTAAGRWLVLACKDGNHIASFQSGKLALSCITYSPDGACVAIGTELGKIYLFSVYDEGKSYRMAATIQGTENRINAIDWSKEGIYIRTMTENFQQNVWNVETLSEVHDLKTIADINWGMQKSTLSYNTAGIWKPGSDLHMLSCDWLATRDLLCAGTEYGYIRLFSYPCQSIESPFREYRTHVSNVNHLSFLTSQSSLVSTGQYDNTVMQWRITYGNITEQGIKNGFFARAVVDRDVNTGGRMLSRRMTNVGHRRVRSSEPVKMAKDRSPFERCSSVSPRMSEIKKFDEDYGKNKVKMDAVETENYLRKNGACEHFVALQKSRSFLKDYNVVKPVTKERQRKKKSEKILPKLQL